MFKNCIQSWNNQRDSLIKEHYFIRVCTMVNFPQLISHIGISVWEYVLVEMYFSLAVLQRFFGRAVVGRVWSQRDKSNCIFGRHQTLWGKLWSGSGFFYLPNRMQLFPSPFSVYFFRCHLKDESRGMKWFISSRMCIISYNTRCESRMCIISYNTQCKSRIFIISYNTRCKSRMFIISYNTRCNC